MERKAELILIRGLPGSGKSVMARRLAESGYEHFEADQYFIGKDGEYKFDGAQIKAAHDWCFDRARATLAAGLPVVVSNTFSRMWELQPYVDLAKELGAPLYVMEARGAFENVHGVPAEHVARMKDRWQALPPPT